MAVERCGPCQSLRRDGQPCDPESCLCRCHREGKKAVDALLDTSLDSARQARGGLRRMSPGLAFTVNVKSFDQELKDGDFVNCAAPVKTVDNSIQPCIREKGHSGGHNPFSVTAPVVAK